MARDKVKQAAYMVKWCEENKERLQAYRKEYNKGRPKKPSTPESIAYGKQWRLDNPDKMKAYAEIGKEQRRITSKEWYHKNRDRELAKTRLPEHKAHRNERERARYASDSEHRRTVQKSNAKRSWTFSEDFTYEMVVELRGQDCFYCGGSGGSVDHLVARTKGGLDRLDNLVPACRSCNGSKGNRSLEEFYKLRVVV